eukprot:m.363850 g.363850  ORF g.363850 m.363850 type:complete len:302 (-) comp24421_c0_seq1:504-1409(-)
MQEANGSKAHTNKAQTHAARKHTMERVQQELAEHGILVSDEWLSARAREGVATTPDAYEAFLISDIADSAAQPVLPDVEHTREGGYAVLSTDVVVQIEGVIDVSKSVYSQLEEYRQETGQNRGANTEVDDEEDISTSTQRTQRTQQRTQSRHASRGFQGNRLLRMKLSDGHGHLVAMEVAPVPDLSREMPPGVKIRIQSGTLIRRGMLLLDPSNCTVLGGHVEALQHTNNYVTLLHHFFGLEVEHIGDEQQGEGEHQQQQAISDGSHTAPAPAVASASASLTLDDDEDSLLAAFDEFEEAM